MLIFSVSFQFLRMTPKSSEEAVCARATHRGAGMPDRVMTTQNHKTTNQPTKVHAAVFCSVACMPRRAAESFDLLIEDNLPQDNHHWGV